MDNKEYSKGISYKINENGTYRVLVSEWKDKTFYNVELLQKNYDGTSDTFTRQLLFNNCEPPKDGDYIKIISGFESNYRNPRDRYNWITTIVVNEYELSESSEKIQKDAILEYQEKINGTSDVEITSEDLPF